MITTNRTLEVYKHSLVASECNRQIRADSNKDPEVLQANVGLQ